jgi:hypothetical protein
LRNGDFITSINDQTFGVFHAAMPPAGTNFAAVAFRKGFGSIRTFGVLESERMPRPPPKWKSCPGALPGRPVEKTERPRFLQREISRNPNLRHLDVRVMTQLIEADVCRGIILQHATLARQANCAISSLKESLSRLQHFGYLRIFSGKARRTANTYEVVWQASRAPVRVEVNAATQAAPNSEAGRLAASIMEICGIAPEDRRSREAVPIVEEWLAKSYHFRIIEQTVRSVMTYQKPTFNTLRYFTPAIAKAHGQTR